MPETALAHDAKHHLLTNALAVFSEKGFAGASTREICTRANVNLSAIKYYFDDKAGLYRATLSWAFASLTASFGDFTDPSLSLREALRQIFLPLLVHGQSSVDQATVHNSFDAQVMRLYLHEMINPSADLHRVLKEAIAPTHERMCALLARHCGVTQIDADLHQLAFSIGSMVHDYYLSRPCIEAIAPDVLHQADATERIVNRLLDYGVVLVDAEKIRRQTTPTSLSLKST